MANRLADSLSPYLLQHADNPVAWQPWGDEAFAEAAARNVPVLLSIGYAACHWCHVMAHESFENPAVAAVMNERFVNIKVDREERPDIDAIYMSAVQLMTGAGGWPLTVFLTPEGEPFYGGTYYPPHDRHGQPGFPRLLDAITEAWSERREQVAASAAELTSGIKQLALNFETIDPGRDVGKLLDSAVTRLLEMEDAPYGGFGPAPKFPPHTALQLLLTIEDARGEPLATRTLDAMAAGGIFDHLAGGFFRYSVDRYWHVPHFEKMLYDNAQLLRAFAQAYRRTGEERHRAVAESIVAWLEAELAVVDAAGNHAFISALDADSEGEEGRYYAWSAEEFAASVEAAGADAELSAARFGVTATGDFEGGNVLRSARSVAELAAERDVSEAVILDRLAAAKEALRSSRAARVRPAADDKVLTSWNGLLMTALAEAGMAFGDRRLVALAGDIGRFVNANLVRDGRLVHAWRAGEARVTGLLEDHAYFGLGLIAYYRASLEPWALHWALELADEIDSRFRDENGGAYFSTGRDHGLIVRPKGLLDGATPSENSAAAELAWWTARYRSDAAAAERALGALQGVSEGASAAPQAFGSALRLLSLDAGAEREIVLVAAEDAPELPAALEVVNRLARPDDVVLQLDTAAHRLAGLPLAAGRVSGETPVGVTAYVCRGGVCRLPVTQVGELERLLRG